MRGDTVGFERDIRVLIEQGGGEEVPVRSRDGVCKVDGWKGFLICRGEDTENISEEVMAKASLIVRTRRRC
jgi:hypothetical protein